MHRRTMPDGTSVPLATHSGGPWHDYHGTIFDHEATTIVDGYAPFSGRYRPQGSLGALSRKPSAGIWTLTVQNYGPFSGTVTGFGLDIATTTGCPGIPPTPTVTPLPLPTPTVTATPTTTPTPLPPLSNDERIAFSSDRYGNYDIFVMNVDGSGQRRLTTDPGDDQAPAWSPDGRRSAFVSDRGGTWDVYAIDVDGTNETRLTYTTPWSVVPAYTGAVACSLRWRMDE